VSIACGKGSDYMQFWRSVYEGRAPHSIPAVEAALGTELKQGNSAREFTEPLLEALTLAYREAKGQPWGRPVRRVSSGEVWGGWGSNPRPAD
jgi:hypothetical protein